MTELCSCDRCQKYLLVGCLWGEMPILHQSMECNHQCDCPPCGPLTAALRCCSGDSSRKQNGIPHRVHCAEHFTSPICSNCPYGTMKGRRAFSSLYRASWCLLVGYVCIHNIVSTQAACRRDPGLWFSPATSHLLQHAE